MKFFVVVVFICYSFVATKDLRSANKNIHEEDFPFLLDVDEGSKKEFLDALFLWNITLTQKVNLLDAWANKQNEGVKKDYEEWKTEVQQFINLMKTVHEKKTANFSVEAKQADQKFFEIWQNDELTPQQKCESFWNLYNFVTENIRKEANLRSPSGFNCSEPPKFILKTLDIPHEND
uniref:SXP/RAL-2 family protein Ani s 5-like cation-binding domain-containing protein n=1 Tax=Panagrolaimus superbus TaxID=310955 RepID=A0A914Y1I8_9BILA